MKLKESMRSEFAIGLFKKTKWYCVLAFLLWGAAQFVEQIPAKYLPNINKVVILIAIFQLFSWGNYSIEYWIDKKSNHGMDPARATTMKALGFLGKLGLWVVLVLLALDNMGVNVTTLVAGLGVGGVAVALAVQNILGDLFASLTIVLDRPFVLGDFVVIGDFKGTIEHIGLKTTRIRSVSGEQLVFSNSDLLQSRIRNFKRMRERRVEFTVGVVYQTSLEKLKKLPLILQQAVESEKGGLVRFDRSFFKAYGPSSVDFECTYWVLDPDYDQFAKIHQEINYKIFEIFEKENIQFAYPTQTLFIEKNPPLS